MNNHIQIADGSYLTFVQGDAKVALVSQGNTGGTLDLNDTGLNFTPDAGDGKLALFAEKSGATFNVTFDGTGTINFGSGSPVITLSKDFSMNLAATTYTGAPIAGNIHGDGVNDVYATLVNGTQIALTSNGNVGANLNIGGVPFNNVTLSGSLILDPLNRSLTFSQGSTLGVDFGTRHVDFTATDNAGGQLTFGANGLTFKTAGGDGGLIMSVTENGVTRQTALNVVGEITYSLDGSITLGADTTVTNTWASGSSLTITSNTGGGAVIHLTDDGLQVTSTNPEAVTATFIGNGANLLNIKLAGTATYNSGDIILGAGSTLTGTNITGVPRIFTASGADATVTLGSYSFAASTAGQCSLTIGDQNYIINHGSFNYAFGGNVKLSAGTDYTTSSAIPVELISLIGNLASFELTDVGVYAVNGTLINNNVAGSTLISNPDGSIVYNGTTYAAGEFTIDAAGNGIGTVISADLAGDFLPNYDNDFTNALQIVDAGTSDNQLSEILPAENLGEVSFGTQTDELSQNPQIVIATEN